MSFGSVNRKMLGLDCIGLLIVPNIIIDREGELAKVLGVPTNFQEAYVHDFLRLIENVLLGIEPLYRSDDMICEIKYKEAKEKCMPFDDSWDFTFTKTNAGMCSLKCLTLVSLIRRGRRLGPLVLERPY